MDRAKHSPTREYFCRSQLQSSEEQESMGERSEWGKVQNNECIIYCMGCDIGEQQIERKQ